MGFHSLIWEERLLSPALLLQGYPFLALLEATSSAGCKVLAISPGWWFPVRRQSPSCAVWNLTAQTPCPCPVSSAQRWPCFWPLCFLPGICVQQVYRIVSEAPCASGCCALLSTFPLSETCCASLMSPLLGSRVNSQHWNHFVLGVLRACGSICI